MVYFTFGDRALENDLNTLHAILVEQGIMVLFCPATDQHRMIDMSIGQLYNILIRYNASRLRNRVSVRDYMYSTLGIDLGSDFTESVPPTLSLDETQPLSDGMVEHALIVS